MCNDYGVDLPFRLFVAVFEDLGIVVDAQGERLNLEPRDEIWPTERAPVIRLADGVAVPAFSLLTTAPGLDVAPIHDRQPVILQRRD